MLPSLHIQHYRSFQQALRQISDLLSQHTVDHTVLKRSVTELQQYFQTQILTLNMTTLTASLEQHIQSIHVEMNKQLRMLAMDLMFLQTARQAPTVTQRLQQIGDRLDMLQRYCETILATAE